ncbi:MAG: hypothetical protein HYR96_01735 [Deltaproteobacteria bacterium]|nr:hypothetical protein [Deltaproteobacteria bacterium]MBI3296000.1 hypothetical protein [Deltaproteobacteria bacterium]
MINWNRKALGPWIWFAVSNLCLVGCSSVEIIESPKTGYVSDAKPMRTPDVIWTSRSMIQDFEFLGQVKTRSLGYDGAFDLLVGGATSMKADALIDIHFEQLGVFSTMQAFAVKYK